MHKLTKKQQEEIALILKKTIDYAGGTQKLANLLTEAGYECRQQTVSSWVHRDGGIVPLMRAVQIDEISEGYIGKHELRPDVFSSPKNSKD